MSKTLRIIGAGVAIALAATACSATKAAPLKAEPVPTAAPSSAPSTWTQAQCSNASKTDWMTFCQQYKVTNEGSVLTADGKWVQYPDGLKVTFVSAVNRPDAKATYSSNVNTNRVRITLRFENTGTVPIPITAWDSNISAFGGVDRFPLGKDSYYSDPSEASSEGSAPTQLAPGSSYEWYMTYNVQAEYRDNISVTLQSHPYDQDSGLAGAAYTPYTFTDIAVAS